MHDVEIVVFFQALIDQNMCWSLQGHYGRQAEALIAAGLCDEAYGRPQSCNRKSGDLVLIRCKPRKV
jgi:hypothetical protein